MTTLDRAAFRAWLERQPAHSYVGIRCHEHACPIAEHLRTVGYEHPAINGFRYLDIGEYHKTPKWAAEFIRRVDVGKVDSHVRRETCLRILDAIPE